MPLPSFCRAVIVMLLAAVVAACATAKHRFVPAPAPSGEAAVVYLYRIFAAPPHLPVRFEIDGRPVVELAQPAYTWVTLSSGAHEIRALWPPGSGGVNLDFTAELMPGHTYYFRLGGYQEISGRRWYVSSRIEEITQEEARRELAGCCRYVPAQSDGRERGARV